MFDEEDEKVTTKTVAESAEPIENDADELDDIFSEATPEKGTKEPTKAKEDKPKKEEKKEKPVSKEDAKKAEIIKLKKELQEDSDEDETPLLKGSDSAEFEKTKKALSETKKWAHTNSQKLKNALKKIDEYKAANVFSDEEYNDLSAALTSEAPEIDYDEVESTPIQTILKLSVDEVENIRKYTDDEQLDDKLDAFSFFLADADKDEVDEAIADIYSLRADKTKMTKKMLSVGKKYYDEVYKDVKEAGGYKKFVAKKNDEVRKLQKKIDKLTKLVSQYDGDFDTPTNKIDELTDSDNFKEGKLDVYEDIFGS